MTRSSPAPAPSSVVEYRAAAVIACWLTYEVLALLARPGWFEHSCLMAILILSAMALLPAVAGGVLVVLSERHRRPTATTILPTAVLVLTGAQLGGLAICALWRGDWTTPFQVLLVWPVPVLIAVPVVSILDLAVVARMARRSNRRESRTDPAMDHQPPVSP